MSVMLALVGRRSRGCGGGSDIRTSAMVWRAQFAARSPPRESRCLLVLPDDAGTGAAPHRAAKEASDRSRSGFPPAVISSWAAVFGPTPYRQQLRVRGPWPGRGSGPRARRPGRSGTGVACEGLQRGQHRRAVGSRAGTAGGQCADQRLLLQGRYFARTGAGAVISMWWIWFIAAALALTAERRALTGPGSLRSGVLRCAWRYRTALRGRPVGVQRVRLAATPPQRPVWAVHLDHLQACGDQARVRPAP